LPSGVALICAWTDLAMKTRSFAAFGPDDLLIDDAAMTYWRSCYAPDPAQWDEPFVSPLRADLASFPPTCIVVGGIDPLYDDGVRFAEKLRAAGRPAELHEYGDMPHDFPLFPPLSAITDAVDRVATFVHGVLEQP
jgi:acetyl esterase